MPSAADPPMIEVERLTLGYGDTVVLENLDFTVPRGDVFAILGGSGSGKSTLLRALTGLEEPLRGTIRIAGAPPPREGPPCYGVLFQSGALFGSMTLAENVTLPLAKWTNLDRTAMDTIVRSKLRLVGLEGFENHLPAEISGGMKKRAGIARALALDPPLLFLDEPSAGLDPVTSAELDDLIATLNANLGMTTIVVTHELRSIFAISSHCIMLDGRTHCIDALGRLGLRTRATRSGEEFIDPRLRVQLASAGITGVRFIQTDFFDPERYPPPRLPFEPPWNYVPSAPSTLKNVEEAAVEIMNRLPVLADRAKDALADVKKTLASIDRLAADLAGEDGSFKQALQELRTAAARVDKALDEAKLGATAASIRDASASVGQAAAGVNDAREELQASLRAVGEALESVRTLADSLERDPSMLLRGPRADGAVPARSR